MPDSPSAVPKTHIGCVFFFHLRDRPFFEQKLTETHLIPRPYRWTEPEWSPATPFPMIDLRTVAPRTVPRAACDPRDFGGFFYEYEPFSPILPHGRRRRGGCGLCRIALRAVGLGRRDDRHRMDGLQHLRLVQSHADVRRQIRRARQYRDPHP